ncbi:MAG TPA: hypothetical protein VG826_23895 [Pirellulales bacterium]|nr:hypothetical protein [Pirellulales bacterium]
MPRDDTPAAPPRTLDDQVSVRVESAWGAAALFCFWQTFGIVLSNAFVFIWTQESTPFGFDTGVLVSGLVWIVIFLSAESYLVGEMRRFFSARGLRAFGDLSSPLELFKLALTLLSAATWLLCFTAYPFPAPTAGPHRLPSLAFLVGAFLLALANDRMNKKSGVKPTVGRVGNIAELVVQLVLVGGVCGVLIAAGYLFIPGGVGFYLFSLLGLGGLLLFASPILLRGTLLTRHLHRCPPHQAADDQPTR